MKIIGITGSSGSGKTTLSEILSKRENVQIIDADKVSRELVTPGNQYLKEIEWTFGVDYLLDDGNLNRKKLADKIYADNEARRLLNNLTFKYVIDEIKRRILKIKTEGNAKYIIIDAPLLFEANMEDICDKVIVLIADEELKIERICTRDGIDSDTAKKRLKIQNNDDYYSSRADYVIINGRNHDLEAEINEILEEIEKNG